MRLGFLFSLGASILAAVPAANPAGAQSSAGALVCADSGYTMPGCSRPSSGGNRPRSTPFAAAYNAIQQNLQNEDNAIQNATTQVLKYIQQNQNNDSDSYDNSAPASAYSTDNSNDSPGPTFDNSAPPPQPDPAEARNEAASELLNDTETLLDSTAVPAAPATPDGSSDTSVADDVSNVLGNSGSGAGVAQDVSDVLGDASTDSSVASDVSSVLGSGPPAAAAPNSVAQNISAALSSDGTALSPSVATTALVASFGAAQSWIPDSQTTPAASAAEIQDADTEVMEANTAQSAPSNDETTQQVESAMSQDEDSPSLGGWLSENLNYVQDGLNYAQQKTRDAVADSTSDDPVAQKVNEIYYAANPLTGLGPAMAAAGGNVPAGLYNYLDTIVNKSGQLFGLIVNPDADQ